jgi:hypothetical protein
MGFLLAEPTQADERSVIRQCEAVHRRNALPAGTPLGAAAGRVARRQEIRSRILKLPAFLTVSDAFRLMMVRIAKEKALPFEPQVPNAETIEAMKAARRGELVTVGPPGDLLASLNADC